jgi:glycosyltransferase involved in cell wall biosynthesis
MRIAILVPDNRDEFRRYSDPEPYFGPAPTALLSGLATIPDCEIHIVCCIQRPLRSPSKLAGNIYYHSVLVPKWGWMRGAYLGCLKAIRRKLREIKPDLVHGQGTERFCALAAVYSGFPNVVTIHGNMREIARVNQAPPFSFLWLAAALESWTLPKAGGVICLSTHTQRQVQALTRTTWVLPNAVTGSFFDVPRQPVAPRQILCVANIIYLKNQAQLIRALDPLAKKTDFKLIFLGRTATTDAYTQEFLHLVRERPWCCYQGFASQPELQTALSRAALVVLPSLEENCPMAVLEAMAAGVPVAAANVGGVPDLIAHDSDGLLFDPTQQESILAAVAELLADEKMAVRLAASAKAKALRSFHPQKVAEKHVAIYKEVIAKRQTCSGCLRSSR